MSRLALLREFGITNFGLCLAWFVAVVAGLVVMFNYESRPGEKPAQPAVFPDNTAIETSKTLPTVIMFIHPHCPCTRASISELERVHSICHRLAEFKLVAFDPVCSGTEWQTSDLVKTAKAIPGVTVHWDKDGKEARRFNVRTSGHVMLYDTTGKLRFSGGVTSSRGHEGSNFGRSQLVSWLRLSPQEREIQTELLESPVYGCALVDGSETDGDE